MVGGLSRVGKDEIRIGFNAPIEKEHREYEDRFPDDLKTIDDVKQKYGKVVWCQYTKCKHNESIKGLQRTSGTLLKNRSYVPLNEQEHIWSNICTRDLVYQDIRIGVVYFKEMVHLMEGTSSHKPVEMLAINI